MRYVYDDGGRSRSGYKGKVGDCACRAIAIAVQIPYKEAYELLMSMRNLPWTETRVRYNPAPWSESRYRNRTLIDSPRSGIHRKLMDSVMDYFGWEWVPTMNIGSGCKVHLRSEELPSGRLICKVSHHYVAVINGVIRDTHDSARNGNRCVYGYYRENIS